MKPTKSGYTFTGWYLDKECTQPWDFAKDTVKENLILYAGWEKIEPNQKNHVVIFNYLIDNEYHSESVSEGNIAAMPAKPCLLYTSAPVLHVLYAWYYYLTSRYEEYAKHMDAILLNLPRIAKAGNEFEMCIRDRCNED